MQKPFPSSSLTDVFNNLIRPATIKKKKNQTKSNKKTHPSNQHPPPPPTPPTKNCIPLGYRPNVYSHFNKSK